MCYFGNKVSQVLIRHIDDVHNLFVFLTNAEVGVDGSTTPHNCLDEEAHRPKGTNILLPGVAAPFGRVLLDVRKVLLVLVLLMIPSRTGSASLGIGRNGSGEKMSQMRPLSNSPLSCKHLLVRP